jgi:3-methylcrotonyl-CoA carboxylase alpha subunit
MFTKILIANRGEIACRVATTARRMGIKTVAVYSDADALAKHVQVCDEAYRLGPSAAKESYLLGEKVLEIAKSCGAQAIHPGYGFLSENEDFAKAVVAAGLVFIGPPASAIAAMGSKSAAKALMEKANVPLVPGYHGDNQVPDFLQAESDRIGYPLMIKASAGGGGKGMRIVRSSAEFSAALVSCKREAINAFGDDKVLVERYVEQPRHVEIQVFADSLGGCVSLFERDCSVQRRHQKVIEEAPAPGMTAERRKAMGEAAVAAAVAVGYQGAGTVEFIADQAGKFFFMEMNTRLQVEHPVTEMITGFDLVEWQLKVAAGLALPATQAELRIDGHSIEARVYAENPDKGFLPSVGKLKYMRTPEAVSFTGQQRPNPASVRVDSGVRSGDSITPFYDPMIAKLIVWGADREQAVQRMRSALDDFQVVGPSTNIEFLKRLMENPAFKSGRLDTGLIERDKAQLIPAAQAPSLTSLAMASGLVITIEGKAQALRQRHSRFPADPWAAQDGWRNTGRQQRVIRFEAVVNEATEIHAVQVTYAAKGYLIRPVAAPSAKAAGVSTPVHPAHSMADTSPVCLAELSWDADKHELSGLLGSERFQVHAYYDEASHQISIFSEQGLLSVKHRPLTADVEGEAAAEGKLTAPMPGKVIALLVDKGSVVKQGQALLVMEAMKMEHTLTAPRDGTVASFAYGVGDQVAEGALLLEFQAS